MITCCDDECARANRCKVGGIQCDRCGEYFCKCDLKYIDGKHLCEDCEEEEEVK